MLRKCVMEFYKNGNVIEGFLGDSNECEILFMLREPNNNGEESTDFWFKRVLSGKAVYEFYHPFYPMSYNKISVKRKM